MAICPECGGVVVEETIDGDYLRASCLDCGAVLNYYLENPEVIEEAQ